MMPITTTTLEDLYNQISLLSTLCMYGYAAMRHSGRHWSTAHNMLFWNVLLFLVRAPAMICIYITCFAVLIFEDAVTLLKMLHAWSRRCAQDQPIITAEYTPRVLSNGRRSKWGPPHLNQTSV
jgi:hypothetical protein